MADPLQIRIADQIVTTIAAITGDSGTTYWYTPDVVQRVKEVTEHLLQASQTTLYFVAPVRRDERSASFGTTGVPVESDHLLLIVMLQRFSAANEETADPDRWEVEERMRFDVAKALRADLTLGGLTYFLDLPDQDQESEDSHLDGWALAFQRVVARAVAAQEAS